MRKLLIVMMCQFFAFSMQAQVETKDSSDNGMINLFLDCPFCDETYIKQNITYVNYVRDRKAADVHLIITAQSTGSNGKEATLFFLGLKQFSGLNDTLKYNSPPDATRDDIWTGMNRRIAFGLMRYVGHSPAIEFVDIINPNNTGETNATLAKDKWRSWVFRVNTGAYFSGEASITSLSAWGSAEITKVTKDWKIELEMSKSFNESTYIIEDEIITSGNSGQFAEANVTRSLTDHSSFAIFNSYVSSEYSNLDKSYRTYVGYEYNLYPYDESARRQMRMNYLIGKRYNDYVDTTLFNKGSEDLYEQKAAIAYKVQETWGSVAAGVTWTNYLKDFSLNNLRLNARFNFRLVKGLSINASATLTLIRNQVELRKSGATDSDILLRQQELATDYRYWSNFGITYTFGSIYNSVVNPRFGG